jgi:predicted nucleotidyltransferase
MDFARPVEAIVPGAQGRILAVLAQTTAELNLRTIARLADVSPAQASRVLPTLTTLGLVERRDAPPSVLYRLVPDHVGARAIVTLTQARRTLFEEFGRTAEESMPGATVVVFGSLARGEATSESDIDILVVRPSGIAEDDVEWATVLQSWKRQVHRLAGNRIDVLEMGEDEVPRKLRSKRPLWVDIRRDGILLAGKPLPAPMVRQRA